MFSELQQTAGAGLLSWGPGSLSGSPGVGN